LKKFHHTTSKEHVCLPHNISSTHIFIALIFPVATTNEKSRGTQLVPFLKKYTGRGLVHFCRPAAGCRSPEETLLEANESRNATWK